MENISDVTLMDNAPGPKGEIDRLFEIFSGIHRVSGSVMLK